MIARQIVLAFGWLVVGLGGWTIVQPIGFGGFILWSLWPRRSEG